MTRPSISDAEVVSLVRSGTYRVDLETGVVYTRSGRRLYTCPGGRAEEYLHVTIWAGGRRRKIPVQKIVWLAGSGVPIPPGFTVHHRDCDTHNNCWKNLFCLFEPDHHKLHHGDLVETPTQEEF